MEKLLTVVKIGFLQNDDAGKVAHFLLPKEKIFYLQVHKEIKTIQ